MIEIHLVEHVEQFTTNLETESLASSCTHDRFGYTRTSEQSKTKVDRAAADQSASSWEVRRENLPLELNHTYPTRGREASESVNIYREKGLVAGARNQHYRIRSTNPVRDRRGYVIMT
jgi:hypothetical protein